MTLLLKYLKMKTMTYYYNYQMLQCLDFGHCKMLSFEMTNYKAEEEEEKTWLSPYELPSVFEDLACNFVSSIRSLKKMKIIFHTTMMATVTNLAIFYIFFNCQGNSCRLIIFLLLKIFKENGFLRKAT